MQTLSRIPPASALFENDNVGEKRSEMLRKWPYTRRRLDKYYIASENVDLRPLGALTVACRKGFTCKTEPGYSSLNVTKQGMFADI